MIPLNTIFVLTKRASVILAFITVGQSLSGCAKSLNAEEKTVDMSYQFNENQCDTTQISYTSTEDLCAKLRDSKLNHYCAERLRFEEFQRKCPNQKWN